MYSKTGTAGQWRAHGRYISRDSAAQGDHRAAGFDRDSAEVDIPETLDAWQNAGDERMWKFIISPEFGGRLDAERLTRELMERMERDLGTRLEWVAVTHHNTDHKHVHVALRGIDVHGKEFRLSPEYVKNGIRAVTEDLSTKQLGYRTQLDAEDALRREVGQSRYTSLDRSIRQNLDAGGAFVAPQHVSMCLSQCMTERLSVLQRMRIVERRAGEWFVREDFEKLLRSAQKATDRQKTLNVHGVTVSDERLPLEVLDLRKTKFIEGRVLVHGEDEATGRSYSMIESVDGRLLFVNHTPEIQEARAKGKMRPDTFVRIQKAFAEGKPLVSVDDLGKAESLLKNDAYFRHKVQQRRGRQANQGAEKWKGWLGLYQERLRAAELAHAAERDSRRVQSSER